MPSITSRLTNIWDVNSISFSPGYGVQHVISSGSLQDVGSSFLGSLKIKATDENPNYGIEGASIELFGGNSDPSVNNGGSAVITLGYTTTDPENSGAFKVRRFDGYSLMSVSGQGHVTVPGQFLAGYLSSSEGSISLKDFLLEQQSGAIELKRQSGSGEIYLDVVNSNASTNAGLRVFGHGKAGDAETNLLEVIKDIGASKYKIRTSVSGSESASNGFLSIESCHDMSLSAASGRALNLIGPKIGLFGVTAVSQPAAIANASDGSNIDVEARAALNSLLAAMRNLGVIAV